MAHVTKVLSGPSFHEFSRSVRAGFGVQTCIRNPQALDGPSVHQMLFYNLCRIRRRHAAVPDSLRVYHHVRPMLALIQASGLVDSHGAFQQPCLACDLRMLLQLRKQFALSIHGAGWARRALWPAVLTHKYMMLKNWQSKIPPSSD
jgi:hypothetical protein